MKRLVLGVGLLLCLSGSAEASVLDWPGISHAVKIGSCVVADAGKIGQSAVRHVAGFGVDVLTIVADCARFIGETLTPGLVSDPHA